MNRLTKVESSSVLIKDGWKKKDTESYTSICYGCEEIGRCVNKCGFYKALEKLAAYEDTGLEPEDILSSIKILSNELNNALAKLKVYRNLEEQGLLIELPCKVGESYTGICQEMVPSKKGWTTKRWLDSGVVEKIEVIVRLTAEKAGHSHGRYVDELGEFWFIGENQREEAEKALEEMNENK